LFKDGHTHAGERKLERDGSADEPSAGDDGLKVFRHFLLAGLSG
jgi:hypothetical protein